MDYRYRVCTLAILGSLASGCADLEKETVTVYVPFEDGGAVSDGGFGSDVAPGDAPVVIPPGVPASDVPFYQAWAQSAHADVTAEAFVHWNAEGAVPTSCARCHSGEGFVDYVGGDGTKPFSVEKPAPVQSVIDCVACHNPAANELSQVTFPSGVTVNGLGGEARCMTCHQGRASGKTVDDAIMTAGVTSDDQISDKLTFRNIHYFPAAATLYAGVAKGGYQYADQVYDTRFRHVETFDTCIECHDPHSARPRFDRCSECHQGVMNVETAHDIRMISSFSRDYDGDGNLGEGIFHEVTGLREKLLAAIVRYGAERATPICYNEQAYPYWFIDTSGDGICSGAELTDTNGFKSWTARLLRASYNYQMATKDPGAFAHNAKYILELLYDSTTDVNKALAVKVDMTRAVRGDRGHFDGSSEAARHWDEDEEVSASCSRCHGGQEGFHFYLTFGVGISVPETGNGLECGTCHTTFGTTFDVLDVAATTFPSKVVRDEPGNDNLCSNCHSGRTSKADIDARIATNKFGFLNVHYLPAASTKLGSAVHVGYEYDNKAYAGPLVHTGGVQCTSCHDPVASNHTFMIEDAWDARCKNCHADANGDPEKVRIVHTADYDKDGNATESLRAEIDGMGDKVLKAMQTIAGANGLCYDEHSYPYFFQDVDMDGKTTCSAADTAKGFTAWNAKLMKAAHNFQFSRKDPGSWAHNFTYVGQLLYDSAEDILNAPPTMIRP